MVEPIKRFIDCYIPTETCNLRCHYCYITQKRKFNSQVCSFDYSPQQIRKALTIQRLGGTCLLNLCAGGETLITGEVIEVIKALLEEGHYLMVVTNGTLSKRFDQMVDFHPDLLARLFFKFSFHYLELLRLSWMDRYFDNVLKMKAAGASFTVEITPSDELIPHIDDVKAICLKKLGAVCHTTIARDDRTGGIDHLSDLDWETYKKTWSSFESELFQFKTEIFYKKRKEFCYAGDWSLYLNLASGTGRQCYCGESIGNLYENSDAPINFNPIGNDCSFPHCYNGHAFLALGDIPKLNAPTYAQLRNRKASDGTEWLQSQMKAFMSQKLYDSNKEYSPARKVLGKIKNRTKRIVQKIR